MCPLTTQRLAAHVWCRVEGRLRQQALHAAAATEAVAAVAVERTTPASAGGAAAQAPCCAGPQHQHQHQHHQGGTSEQHPRHEQQQQQQQQQLLPLIPARVYAVAAVWIAAKLEEPRDDLPATATLAALARCSSAVLSEAELRILQWCDWAPLQGFVPVA
ncbi:hypothetical protein HYH02_007376 [Chlamydomonas schloesseri]|uniref:Uncharacterized protein n=1 Tax=Chlamydomonas schloesseri TaxID=2026947 RepID=A0A836B5D8_9CHLO|nr:hypothetical protein HYH02_007376 [Chlamydomonas schloesseri]|eukprot:KAG2447923.1 hypothetical protein HYH02_007376 [Chlamydomonas schloesseri]